MKVKTGFRYRSIVRFVDGDLPRVLGNRRILNALVEYGQYGEDFVRNAVGSGAKPQLVVIPKGTGVYGHYPGTGDTIQLNEIIARQYDKLLTFGYQPYGKAADWDRLLRRCAKMVEAIILHEMVHWMDKQFDGVTSDRRNRRGLDWGHEFEMKAYGRIVSTNDIDGWMGWSWIKHNGKTYGIPFDMLDDYPPPLPPPGRRGKSVMSLGTKRRRR